MKSILSLILLFSGYVASAEIPVHADRNELEYNKQFTIGLNGYDPVSYFAEGGSVPVLGSETIAFTYGTIEYRFASEENRSLFMSNPLKYEPTYGGWCAYAMSENSKVQINPLYYTIHGNRAHFFISRSAKRTFDEEIAIREPAADGYWTTYSGEAPRL